jgi:hypothetical protein
MTVFLTEKLVASPRYPHHTHYTLIELFGSEL